MKAVFFDLDGVLIDSEGVWRACSRQAFAAIGITLSDALYARCAGLNGPDGVCTVLEAFPGVRADPRLLQLDVERRVEEALSRDAHPMPGANTLLRRLGDRGLPLALVSASPPKLIQHVLASQGWRDCFKAVLSTEDVGPGKPHPAVYLEAVRRLGVAAVDGVAIEDSWAGVQAACAAGLRVVAVPTEGAPIDQIRRHAAFLAGSLQEAAAWLFGQLGAAAS